MQLTGSEASGDHIWIVVVPRHACYHQLTRISASMKECRVDLYNQSVDQLSFLNVLYTPASFS